jgi:hypothetical protein
MNMERFAALPPMALRVGATIVTLVWAGVSLLLDLSTSLLVWMSSKWSIVPQEQQMAATITQSNFCYLVPVPVGKSSFSSEWQMMIMNSGSTPQRNIRMRIHKHRAGTTPSEFVEAAMPPVRRVFISILNGSVSPSNGVMSSLNFTLKPDDYSIDIRTSTGAFYEKLKPLKESGYDISVVDCPQRSQERTHFCSWKVTHRVRMSLRSTHGICRHFAYFEKSFLCSIEGHSFVPTCIP